MNFETRDRSGQLGMEQHISADIAYAVWQYWRATGDDGFFIDAGVEILLETARFWASRAVPEADGKRHIRHVIGPDEYHEDVDDNAYTNVMARWNIARGLEAIGVIRARWPERAAALWERLALGEPELADWRDAVERIATGCDPATGLCKQFAGYYKLEPLDLSLYANRNVPIDAVIGRQRTQRSQVVKQANVVALLAPALSWCQFSFADFSVDGESSKDNMSPCSKSRSYHAVPMVRIRLPPTGSLVRT